jgi:hypothetical protein
MKNLTNVGQGETALIAIAKNGSNVIRVEQFRDKKKEEEYKKALDKVLLRAQKNDW